MKRRDFLLGALAAPALATVGGGAATSRWDRAAYRKRSESRVVVSRVEVLHDILHSLDGVSEGSAALTDSELADFAARDIAAGRRCVEPIAGVVQGIDKRGGLLVDVGSRTVAVRTGSLVLKEAQ